MCSLRFENNLLSIEGVRFASKSKKTPLSKLLFAFVSLALPLLKLCMREEQNYLAADGLGGQLRHQLANSPTDPLR